MKYLIISCSLAISCICFTGCACDEHQTRQTSSASMTVDSKDMHARSH